MNQLEHTTILAFTGSAGVGKTTATTYLTEKGFPKIEPAKHDNNIDEIITEINHLVSAGQHRIVIDGLVDQQAVAALHHEFPMHVRIVAISRPGLPNDDSIKPNITINNDSDVQTFLEQIDAVTKL